MVIRTLLLLFLATSALAAEPAAEAGRVVALRGKATVRSGGAESLPLKRRDVVHVGDVVKTADRAVARILLKDGSVLDIGPGSQVTVRAFELRAEKRSVEIGVEVGRLWARVTRTASSDPDFRIRTANAVAGVRGTTVGAEADGDSSTFAVLNGDAGVDGANGEHTDLGANQETTADENGVGDATEASDATKQSYGDSNSWVSSHDQSDPVGGDALTDLGSSDGSEDGSPGEELPSDATLSLDPGANLTRVNARVEVRDIP